MNLAKLHLHWGSSKHKGKSYRSYSLARAYRDESGKNYKEIVLKLSKLSDDEVDNWRNFLRSAKDPKVFFTTTDNIIVSKHLDYLDVTASVLYGICRVSQYRVQKSKKYQTT